MAKKARRSKQGDWLRCNRCGNPERKGHRWMQRGEDPPVSCPDCRSKYWDKPRVRHRPGLGDGGEEVVASSSTNK